MAAIYKDYSLTEPNKDKLIMRIRPEILKKRFLELYIQTANIAETCRILGMIKRTFYYWRQSDKEFEASFQEADKLALGVLEDEAHRRAVFGTEKPVYQGGKLAGYTKEYSDTLMIVLLKARAPQKYKERFSGELMGADGKPLMQNNFQLVHVHANVPISHHEEDIQQISGPPLSITDVQELQMEEKDIDELLTDQQASPPEDELLT